jgi:hypothetical protein
MRTLSLTAVALFCSCMLSISCKESIAKRVDTIPLEKDTYEIINVCLSQQVSGESKHMDNLEDKLTTEPYKYRGDNSQIIAGAFHKDEFGYIQQQLNDTTAFQLHRDSISEAVNLIKVQKTNGIRSFWKVYNKNHTGALITISKPVFSKNGKIAVVSFSSSYGSLSGSGYMLAFEKKTEGWKITKTLYFWIS